MEAGAAERVRKAKKLQAASRRSLAWQGAQAKRDERAGAAERDHEVLSVDLYFHIHPLKKVYIVFGPDPTSP